MYQWVTRVSETKVRKFNLIKLKYYVQWKLQGLKLKLHRMKFNRLSIPGEKKKKIVIIIIIIKASLFFWCPGKTRSFNGEAWLHQPTEWMYPRDKWVEVILPKNSLLSRKFFSLAVWGLWTNFISPRVTPKKEVMFVSLHSCSLWSEV